MLNPKKFMFDQLADLARALGNSHRLEILEHVSQGERSVERLAQLTGLSVANVSQHLQHLRRAGFVQSRRDGKHVLYRLGEGPITALIAGLRSYAEVNRAEVQCFVSDYYDRMDDLEPVSREDLLARLQDGTVTLLDVRPEDEFAQGHLPGALNIQLHELEQGLASLSREQDLVAYCRGPYCVLSFEVIAALRAKGYRIRRLEDGFPEWKAAGLEVVMSA